MATTITKLAGESSRSLSKRVAFRVDLLNSVACPGGKDRIWIYDSRTPGLCLMVTAASSKAFYCYRKVLGRPQRVRLGRYPDISMEQARKLCRQTVGDIAAGGNPMRDKREARARGMTLGELWEWFLENWAKPRKRSWHDDELRYKQWLQTWAARRLTEITRADVAALHQQIAKKTSGPTANRVLSLLSAMLNRGRRIGWEKDNPCRGVEKFPETSRERFLSADELARFFKAIEAEPNSDWRDLFRLSLFTGARRRNVLSMEWKEMDFKAQTWTIPAEKFKNKKAMRVPLTAAAIEILNARKGNGSSYVFPSRHREGHVTAPYPAWKSICERAKLEDVRIHDLRRTMGSWQAAAGASTTIIGKSLGNRSYQATAVYARLDVSPVRKSIEAATAAMLAVKESG